MNPTRYDTLKIKLINGEQFLKDLKRVRDVVVYAQTSKTFFRVRKMEVKSDAQTTKIYYYITDTIYKVKRDVMVII